MRRYHITLILLLLAFPSQLEARQNDPASRHLDALGACRSIADASVRADCYDRGYDALIAARDRKDVLIVDRETVREAKRGLFGFSLSSIRLFGGRDDEDEIREIDSTVQSARRGRNGEWIIAIANGSRWRQIDDKFLMEPKQGQSINIRKGSFGAYVARVNEKNGVKVVREN